MENSGVFIDLPKCQVIETRLRELQAQAIQQAKDIAGHDFDITNRDHIEKIVFDELDVNSEDKVKIKVTKTGKKSVDKKTLSKFADNPFVKTYLDAKAKEKNIGTYLEPINELVSDIDGLLHGSFNQSLTSTGRLSSGGGGLNLQNIPSRTEEGRLIRSLFTSRWKDIGGQILSADYSQMEVRLIAHMANEPIFIEAFNTNKDVHTYVGSLINDVPYEAVTKEQRTAAKTTNLGLIYQMGLQKLMSETGMTEEQALKFLDTYMSKLVKIKWWLGWAKQFVRTNGYAETIFGRRRYMPDIYSSKLYLREAAGREGPNMKVQGTGADIVKLAMKACYDKIKQNSMKSKLILQVHDELVFDVHPNELESMKKLAEDIMPNVVTLKIPLEVEAKLANSWAEAH
jgi:DNA polymerase-1